MNKNGAVIIIEDDSDDRDFLKEVFYNLNYGNEVIFFSTGEEALEYVQEEKNEPFLILSDINMPKLNGYELRKKIQTDEKLAIKCIPYLFFTTTARKQDVINAYSMSVQGFFTKPDSLEKLQRIIKLIMDYWKECAAPNHFN